jgi:hypothetical protein
LAARISELARKITLDTAALFLALRRKETPPLAKILMERFYFIAHFGGSIERLFRVLPVPPFQFSRVVRFVFGEIDGKTIDVQNAAVYPAAMILAVFLINFLGILSLEGFYCWVPGVCQVPRHVFPDARNAFKLGLCHRLSLYPPEKSYQSHIQTLASMIARSRQRAPSANGLFAAMLFRVDDYHCVKVVVDSDIAREFALEICLDVFISLARVNRQAR